MNQRFTTFRNKFGDKFLRKNTSDLEEVIYEGEDGTPEQIHKAALDTILDVTKNPERQQ